MPKLGHWINVYNVWSMSDLCNVSNVSVVSIFFYFFLEKVVFFFESPELI